MIIDHALSTTTSVLSCDICVIGTGAAGLALADEFKDSDLQVVLLESGGWNYDQRTQDLYHTEQTAKRFESAHSGRFRVLGGSTTRWGGQSLPLTPIDFKFRPWVSHSGWPISYEELQPYYDRANRFLGVDTRDYRDETAGVLRMKRPEFEPGLLEYHYSKWAPQPDLIKTYRKQVDKSANIRVILHANVTELVQEEGSVAYAKYSSLEGSLGEVKAGVFIIATGGIEAPRLLLASRFHDRRGLGNEHDLVGRFLQEHPAMRLGVLESKQYDQIQALFNGKRAGGKRFSSRISLSPVIQEKEQLLNASAGFLFSLPEDSGFSLIRSLIRGRFSSVKGITITRVISEFMRSFPDLVKAAWFLLLRGRIFTPGGICEVAGSFEQEPDPDSRVSLSNQCDELGMPLSCIHWKISEKTMKTARIFSKLIDLECRRLGIGALNISSWLTEDQAPEKYEDHFHDQNHHIGTARMSLSPETGVVNTHLKVHTISNLYIASSAVFPTGGHSNPTLTLLALAIRLADHIKSHQR